MRLKRLFGAIIGTILLTLGVVAVNESVKEMEVHAADSGLTASDGTFVIDFYDSSKLSSTSGTGLSNNNYINFVKVADGLTKSEVVTGASVTGTVQYGKNGGLTAGTGTAAGANSHYVTFSIGAEYAVKKCTVYATAYETGRWLLNNNSADSGSLGSKGANFANVTSPLVWDGLNDLTTLTFKKDDGNGGNQKRLTIYTIVCQYNIPDPLPQYTVTFDSNGGTAIEAGLSSNSTGLVSSPTNPTRDGYEFLGWFEDLDSDKEFDEGTETMWNFNQNQVSDNITLTARWEEIIIITYTEATKLDDLVPGMNFIIVDESATKAISTDQRSNNRGSISVSSTNNTISLNSNSEAEVFTLIKDSETGYYALKTHDDKYLYAASSGNNYLRSQSENDDNGLWSLTYSESVLLAVAQGENTRNTLQNNGDIFACYGSASQTDVAIYYDPSTIHNISYDANDGSGSLEATKFVSGYKVTLRNGNTLTAPNGKVFDHWNTEPDNSGASYTTTAKITSDVNVTLYAQYVDSISESDIQNAANTVESFMDLSYSYTEVHHKYVKVSNVNDITSGDKVIFVNEENQKCSYTLSSNLLNTKSVSITNGEFYSYLNPFTIEIEDNHYTFANNNGELLGSTEAKKLGFGVGTTTWNLSFEEGNAIITNTTASYGTIYYNYNNGNDRFLNYANSSLAAVQLYKKVAINNPTYIDCSFKLGFAVDNTNPGLDIAYSLGIKVEDNKGNSHEFTSLHTDGNKLYIVINLGDIINNYDENKYDRAEIEFTVTSFIDVGGIKKYCTTDSKIKTYSINDLILEYVVNSDELGISDNQVTLLSNLYDILNPA